MLVYTVACVLYQFNDYVHVPCKILSEALRQDSNSKDQLFLQLEVILIGQVVYQLIDNFIAYLFTTLREKSIKAPLPNRNVSLLQTLK